MKTLHTLTAGLVSAISILAQRHALPLLLLVVGLVLVQPCAADSGFTATGSLATARLYHSATLLPNGKVLVAGGIDSSFNRIVVSAELYDPASGTWTGTGDMDHGGLAAHTAILLPNGKVLVAGGGLYSELSFQNSDHAELYEPASGTWTSTGPITSFFDRSATLLPNGKVLLAGGDNGEDSNGVSSAELYDPASETSTPTGSLGTARSHHPATLLPNGKVLVTGGYDSSGNLTTSAELYDPASGTWTATGSLGTARLGHTATLLANGKVLVVGGRNSSGGLASAELYDPASGAWTATGSLTTARVGHTATLLSNGNVLFAGGVNDTGVLASAELYGPVSPSAQLLNVATRLKVLSGDNVLIGGFIITGTAPKKVIILGVGPSLAQFFSGTLANPTLELHQGDTLLQTNDDWKSDQQTEIEATGLAPTNDLESAIVRTLDPGSYTAILRGKGDTTGIGVVQAYDLNQAADSKFGNIATRGFVDSGDNVMIGGFIVGPASGGSTTVVVRAIGPSLTNFGVSGVLPDPTVELHDGNGATIAFNDNWGDDANQGSIPPSLQPGDPHESALYRVLAPGGYTAIMRGAGNSTGIGLVEVYNLQ
ncbi:MAG: hypothetical protein QOE26_454 [Verrucomicrobiota bacterium]